MNQAITFQLTPESRAVMACVDAFEQTPTGDQSDLRSFLQDVPQEYRASALVELVRVDLERQRKRGATRPIHQYLEDYPELISSDASFLRLLHDEFEMRIKAGEQPSADEYRKLHPGFSPQQASAETGHVVDSTVGGAGRRAALAGEQPERVGKYKVLRQLGAGGFGVVYEGYDEQLERHVAIKLSRGADSRSGLAVDLLHEARSIANLDHSGIVKLLEIGETTEGHGYVTYEFVAGDTLADRIARGGYTAAQAAEWAAQVAEALHYAHKRGIIHRDVKPANVLVDTDGRARVVDFGLARRNDQFFLNDHGQVLGTLAYLSPEQAVGDSHWSSAQSDIYSLGVVLYELLCRKTPFRGEKIKDVLEQVKHRAPPPPRSIDDSIPQRLEEVCLKALAKRPQERYKTGLDMAADLRAAVRPAGASWPIKALRAALILVAMSALCLLLIWATAPKPAAGPTTPFEFKNFKIWMRTANTMRPLTAEDLPLAAEQKLEIQAPFTQPAYGYLLMCENGEKPKLLSPATDEDFEHQRPVDRFIYPAAGGQATTAATVPNVDGASMLVVIASPRPLTKEDLQPVLGTPLDLNISQSEAAQLNSPFLVADPYPSWDTPLPLRSGSSAVIDKLQVPEAFKQALRGGGSVRTYCGEIISHKKSDTSVEN